MAKIPREYHFIFGLTADHGGMPFSYIHYLAVLTCHTVNRPERITFHYAYEPVGEWWERAKPYLHCMKVEPPHEIFGNPITHPAHMADVLRLEILLERGGIYLDMDVLCVRPFDSLLDEETVLGAESGTGLCNAVILARPGAPFLERWYAAYRSFRATEWNTHSVLMPHRLAAENPELVHVLEPDRFFWPMHWAEHLRAFFLMPGSTFCERSFCVHLWQSETWPLLERLTPLHGLVVDSEFSRLIRPYVPFDYSCDRQPAAHGAPVQQELDALLDRLGLDTLTSRHEHTPARIVEACRRALGHFDSQERELVTACSYYGLPVAAIASFLRASVDDVTRLHATAREKVRARLMRQLSWS